MRLFLIPFFVFVFSVICINGDSEYVVVQGRYNLNRPPWAEDYNPIPVAVVYEDDAISGKLIKAKVESNYTQKADLDGSQITEDTVTDVVEPRTETTRDIKEKEGDDILANPKARALSDLQIPVVVVYDPAPETLSSQKTKSPTIKANRRKIKQLRRRKLQNKTSVSDPLVQSTEPTIMKAESLVKPQSVSNKQGPDLENTLRKQRTRERDPVVPIINSENYVYAHSGNFHYSYEGGDGTRAHSEGQLMRNLNDEAAGEAVSGGFSYTDKEGNDFSLSYTADERGYRPIGAHLPTPPPIPPAIARALAYLATATTPESVTKPSKS